MAQALDVSQGTVFKVKRRLAEGGPSGTANPRTPECDSCTRAPSVPNRSRLTQLPPSSPSSSPFRIAHTTSSCFESTASLSWMR
ncbi:MAG: hypothetical protein F4X66_07510 [Chloroflexi bacterium]|nr:hypothetical protein [Chloroflexota bacterium]